MNNRNGRNRVGVTRRSNNSLKLETLEQRCLLAGDLFITEFVADNGRGIRDSFGDRSDWIEIFNNGNSTADLTQYSLSDDATDPVRGV